MNVFDDVSRFLEKQLEEFLPTKFSAGMSELRKLNGQDDRILPLPPKNGKLHC